MIDHIIYADPDLDRAIRKFATEYEIEPAIGGRHPGFGTRNALIGLTEGAYLELLGIDPEQDVSPSRRFLQLKRGSPPGFIAWCARADRPLRETVDIARAASYDLGGITTMSRKRPDGSMMFWNLTPYADRDGVLPFYIDWGGTPNPATSLMPLLSLVSLALVHPDPTRIRTILNALGEHEIEVEWGPSPELKVTLRH